MGTLDSLQTPSKCRAILTLRRCPAKPVSQSRLSGPTSGTVNPAARLTVPAVPFDYSFRDAPQSCATVRDSPVKMWARLVLRPYSEPVTAVDSGVIATFTMPPVVEVVTSMRFAPMRPTAFFALSTFWREAWAKDFPGFELQGPYDAPVETFSAGAAQPRGIAFGFQEGLPLPRVWISSEDGQHLLQVQKDWFAANWRRHSADGEAEYDRWPARRGQFLQRWEEFRGWLVSQGEAALPNQCEVTYINHIQPVDGIWTTHADVERVLPGLGLTSAVAGRTEQAAWRSQHLVAAEGDLPPARLHVSMTPAFTGPGPEPSPIYVLELTVRGAPALNGDFGTFGDRGRRVIVESFLAITSDELREAWGQK